MHGFVFQYPGELLFGCALYYSGRIFERQWGSEKYGNFTILVMGLSWLLETLMATVLKIKSASGLYPLIFANLVSFTLDIPAMHRISVFGLRMTDKVRGLNHTLTVGVRELHLEA